MKKTDQKHLMMLNCIMGHIAMWAVRQSPYHSPDGLLDVLAKFKKNCGGRFDKNGRAQMTYRELETMLNTVLLKIPQFLQWNERRNGNQAPFGFSSRYDQPHPDDDFIDLGALTRNVRMSVQREYERDDQFNADFDRRWRRGWLMRILRGWYWRINPPKQ
jgi:hypothetical protein